MDAVDVVEAPCTPAHLAYAAEQGLWAFPKWLQYLNEEVTAFLLEPEQGFLAVEASIRVGKSMYCSTHVPAWYLGMNPRHRALSTSYADSLATEFSGRARDILETHGEAMFGVRVRPHQSAADWHITEIRERGEWKRPAPGSQGGMRAVPRRGQIIGKGANLMVIDDPIKDDVEADSKLERDKLWSWYTRVVRGRLEPGGKIIVIMARWHEDDLIGRLFDRKYRAEFSDPWRRIHLPALATPAPWEVDERGELKEGTIDEWRDVIGRRKGEALWPERAPESRLNQERVSIGPLAFNANYQQNPTSAEGGMFPKTKWRYIPKTSVPKIIAWVRYWDLAATTTGDWVVGFLLGLDNDLQTYLFDPARMRGGVLDVEQHVTGVAELDAVHHGIGVVKHWVEQEPGSGGLSQAERFVRVMLAGHTAEKIPVGTNKTAMAGPFAGQQQAGNVFIVQDLVDGQWVAPAWTEDFVEEAFVFPNGSHDDQIDSAAKGYLLANAAVLKARKQRLKTNRVAGLTIG